ncbi:MAG: chemotaxis protein CheC [Promethearchaeota archaeon]
MAKKEKNEDYVLFDDIKLTPFQLDSLMELGNIGSGNAITALSQLLNKTIRVSLTSVELIPFWKLPDEFGGREIEVFGILSHVEENQTLSILQIYTKESVINVINNLSDKSIDNIKEIRQLSDLDDIILSTITEVGNILSSHYANALADLLETKLVPTVPNIAFDSLGAIMDSIVSRSAEHVDLMIMINTKMDIEDLDINGILVFLPAVDTLKSLFKTLNIE